MSGQLCKTGNRTISIIIIIIIIIIFIIIKSPDARVYWSMFTLPKFIVGRPFAM